MTWRKLSGLKPRMRRSKKGTKTHKIYFQDTFFPSNVTNDDSLSKCVKEFSDPRDGVLSTEADVIYYFLIRWCYLTARECDIKSRLIPDSTPSGVLFVCVNNILFPTLDSFYYPFDLNFQKNTSSLQSLRGTTANKAGIYKLTCTI